MLKSIVSVVTGSSILLAAAAPAHASPEPRDSEYSAGDWTLSFLVGTASGMMGAAIGGGIGYALAPPCVDDGSLFGCAFEGFAEAGVGAAIGNTFGGAAGVYAYGELSGHDGSYWGALGGWAVGLGAAFGISALAHELDDGGGGANVVTWVTWFTLPVLASTLGYVWTLKGDNEPAPTGALLGVDGGKFSLGVPEIGVRLSAAGQFERVDVRLLGGRF